VRWERRKDVRHVRRIYKSAGRRRKSIAFLEVPSYPALPSNRSSNMKIKLLEW
jgi:hypothetical protein